MQTKTTEKIVLISTESDVFVRLKSVFENRGYVLERVLSWEEALETFFEREPDLILYDLGPSSPGRVVEICRIRLRFQGLLIMLLVVDDPLFNTLALEVGADDCLPRSVPDQLLAAKVMSLRRRERLSRWSAGNNMVLGNLVMNTASREVRLKGMTLNLTTIEYDLLCFLACNMGSVVSRDDIHQALYNGEYDGLNRSIDLYISRLRRKLGDDPAAPKLLKTVRGAGYLLVDSSP